LRAVLELSAEAAARGGFPHELALSLTLSVGRSLRMALAVRNMNGAPATFEEALHSYFAVSDVRQVRIRGLEGVGYLDKTAAMTRKPGETGPITIVAETDRVYLGTTRTVTIEDPGWRRRIVVSKAGSATTVVWNPWIAKAKAMPDFGDDEWTGMVCVETANAGGRGHARPRREPCHDRDDRGDIRLSRRHSGSRRAVCSKSGCSSSTTEPSASWTEALYRMARPSRETQVRTRPDSPAGPL
jgi:D-hexose-6-phosphate mutarotase